MHDNLFDFACKELEELDRKAKSGSLSMAEMQYADLLAHYKKSALAVEGMEGEEGYSGFYPYSYGGSYRSYRGMGNRSYARKRDSMGRYSRNDLTDKLRELMDDAPDDRTRQEMHRMIDKLENA